MSGANKSKRFVLAILSLLVTVVVLVAGVLAWGLSTTTGASFLITQGVRLAGGTSELDNLQGSVLDGLRAKRLQIKLISLDLELEQFAISLNAARLWQDRVIHLSQLEAKRVYLNLRPSDSPTKIPTSIGIPLNVQLDALRVGALDIARQDQLLPISGSQIDVQIKGGVQNYQVHIRRLGAVSKDAAMQLNGDMQVNVAQPFNGNVHLQVNVRQQTLSAQGSIDAKGSMNDASVDIKAHGEGLGVNAQAHLNFQHDFPLDAVDASVYGFNPHAWGLTDQVADVSLNLRAQVERKEQALWLNSQLNVTNALAGRLDQGRFPISHITARLANPLKNIKYVDVPEYSLSLFTQGQVAGDMKIDVSNIYVNGIARLGRVNASAIHASAPRTNLGGQVRLQASAQRQSFDLSVQDQGVAQGVRLAARGSVEQQRLRLTVFDARMGSSSLIGNGSYEFKGAHRFDANAQLRQFSPVSWWQMEGLPNASVSATIRANGNLQPVLNLGAQINIDNPSSWNAQPLQGGGTLQVQAAQLRHIQASLSVATNTFFAQGALGRPNDKLVLSVSAPELQLLAPSIAGKFYLKGSLAGNLNAPAASLDFEGAKLVLPSDLSIAKLDGFFKLAGGTSAQSGVDAMVDVKNVIHRPSRFVARQATLKATGPLSDHQISLTGDLSLSGYRGASLKLATLLKGAWGASAQRVGWRGSLEKFEVKQKAYYLNLDKPMALTLLPAAGPRGLYAELGQTQLNIRFQEGQRSRIEHEKTVWDGGKWSSKGVLSGMAWLPNLGILIAEGVLPRRGSALFMDGAWDLRFTDTLEGSFQAQRRSGDLWIPNEPPIPMGLSKVLIDVQAKRLALGRSRITLNTDVQGTGFGFLKVDASADLLSKGMNFSLDTERQATLDASLNVKDIAWTALLAGDDMALGGGLQGEVHVRHEGNRWLSSGGLRSDDLRVLRIDEGVRLLNGSLRLSLRNEMVELERLRFPTVLRVTPSDNRVRAWVGVKENQTGSFDISGLWSLATHSGNLVVGLQRFPVVQRSDRFVVATGQSQINLSPTAVSINGKFKSDIAWIDFGTASPSRVSDDVQIRMPEEGRSRKNNLAVNLNVDIDLGERFYLQGMGLYTQIGGQLAIRREANELKAYGQVRTTNGRYRFLGQELTVRRGVVTFQGPLDNPQLDVVAVRQNTAVQAGVRIRGTARRFSIDLFSDPMLSDVEILSWLVLGRGPDEGGADLAFLVGVAGSVFGMDSSDGVKRFLGLDEFGIRTGNISQGRGITPENTIAGDSTASNVTQSGEFFVIGKRFSESTNVTYQQALAGSEGVLLFSYRLTNRLSLVARGGSVNGLELLYSLFFDD